MTAVLAFRADIVASARRVIEFVAPEQRRLRVTVYTAPPEADYEKARENPSYILVEDIGPAPDA